MIQHGVERHEDHFLRNRRWIRKVFEDPTTGEWYSNWKQLSQSLNRRGIEQGEFFLQYGETHLRSMYERNKDLVLGNAHNEPTCKQCGIEVEWDHKRNYFSAFCGFSCSTNWYAQNTDRPRQAMITLAERKKADPSHHLIPQQSQYWIAKGFPEIEAKAKVRERQQTFRLDKLMAKHGEVEGKRIWNDRQERWMTSFMASRDINDSHTISKVSREMFDRLAESYPTIKYGRDEHMVFAEHKTHRVDCYHPETQKIIEFYGDYYHGNPAKYQPMDMLRSRIAEDQWEKDRTRVERILTNKNVRDVLIIWESDWRKYPEETIEKCSSFLQD